jgi:iron complex outermembrane receptor protein
MSTSTNVLFWASLLFVVHATAQTINGRLIDHQFNPIPNAKVEVLNSVQTTTSNESGFFKLSFPKGIYFIKTTAPLFNINTSKIEILDSSVAIVIQLQPSTKELETVVVTATKREESNITIPIAVTSLSAEKVNTQHIWELEHLAALVPNLQYANLGVGYQQQIAIRGISVFSETPSIATYVDGVNALDIAANGMRLIDIDRIEILRGPQGTLFGRNAMGGVINITTKQPGNTTNAQSEISIGNQGLKRFSFGVKTPLVNQKLFLGIAGQFQELHGFYKNDLTSKTDFLHQPLAGTAEDGKRMGDETSWYGSMYLKYLHNEKLSIVFNSKFQYDYSTGASAYYQAAENSEIALNTPYTMAVNKLGSNSRWVSNSSIAITADQKKFRIISTTAYQYILQAYKGIDQDLYPYDLGTGYSFQTKLGDAYPQGVFSQELRFTSPSKNSQLKWTTGMYFFCQDYNKRYATVYEDLALFFGLQPGTEIYKTDQLNTGVALYGNADYTFKKKWTLNIGLRFDYEHRKSDVARYYSLANGEKSFSVPDTTLRSHFQAASPKVSLQYSFSEKQNIYISYSRGFRAGGNNMFSRGKYAQYLPEYSDNVELGHKFSAFKNRLTINSCLFFLYWQNMQLDMQPEPGVWIINNVGKAMSYGLEVELNAKPVKGLEVDMALGVNNSRYGNFNFLGQNIKGNHTILAPLYTFTLGAQQTVPISKTLSMSVRAEYRSIGKQYFDLTNTIHQPAYHLLHLQAALLHKHFSFAFWCQNVTNTKYLTYAMPGYFKNALINRPRMYGGTLTIKI